MINLTKNNWLTTNIEMRQRGFNVNFKVCLNPYRHHQIKSFKEECLITACELAGLNTPLFVGLSGGYDSEYVCSILLEAGVDFTPVIVIFDGNQAEIEYALRFCDKNKLSPSIIQLSDFELATIICKDIIMGLNGTGIFSVGAIASKKHADSNKGILVTGDHMIGDDEQIDQFIFYVGEHDFYANGIGFFTYRIELVKAMIDLVPKYSDWLEYKHKVYGIQHRKKNRPKFNDNVKNVVNSCFAMYHKPVSSKQVFGTRQQLLDLLNDSR